MGEAQLAKLLAAHLDLAYVPEPLDPEAEALTRVKASLARSKGVLPLAVEGRVLKVALADPFDAGIADDLAFQSGCHVEAVVAPPSAVARAVAKAYGEELPALLEELGPAGGAAAAETRAGGAGPTISRRRPAPRRSSESSITSWPTRWASGPATSTSR